MKSQTINFLFLGGAKRVGMCRLLNDAGKRMGYVCNFFSYELDSRCPLASVATIIEGLRWSDPELMPHLRSVVDKYDIDIIIPFVDPAIEVAVRCRDQFDKKIFVPCGSLDSCADTFNKRTAAAVLEEAGIPIPRTYVPDMGFKQLIAKPVMGSASKGIVLIDSQKDFESIAAHQENYLIQERIDNREEITVDCYASLLSGRISVSPRLRLEVSGGEAVRTLTIDDEQCCELARRVIRTFRLAGAVTVQLIRNLDNGRLMVMEINARLGGAAVASCYAGMDIPSMIISDFLGLESEPSVAQPGVLTTRYPADVVFR